MTKFTERELSNEVLPVVALVLGLYLGLQIFGWL
jgi:hypothetical protein